MPILVVQRRFFARAMRFASLLLVLVAVAGCGQRGPLYLRDAPPPGLKPAKPEAYTPVPYPREPAEEAEAKKRR